MKLRRHRLARIAVVNTAAYKDLDTRGRVGLLCPPHEQAILSSSSRKYSSSPVAPPRRADSLSQEQAGGRRPAPFYRQGKLSRFFTDIGRLEFSPANSQLINTATDLGPL